MWGIYFGRTLVPELSTMSHYIKRSRNVKSRKVKDTTMQSVEDVLSQVIHDVAAEDIQAPATLLSSSCNQADGVVETMTQPTQGATTEADDVGSNERSRARRHTPSPSQPFAADPPRQVRSSLRHSLRSSPSQDSGVPPVDDVADEGVRHPALSSRHNHEAEDPPTVEPNDVIDNQRNTMGRQTLTATAVQQLPADSPGQFKASKRSSH